MTNTSRRLPKHQQSDYRNFYHSAKLPVVSPKIEFFSHMGFRSSKDYTAYSEETNFLQALRREISSINEITWITSRIDSYIANEIHLTSMRNYNADTINPAGSPTGKNSSRKYGSSIINITQNLSDFTKRDGALDMLFTSILNCNNHDKSLYYFKIIYKTLLTKLK
jgi:hypothetical protein